MVIETSVFERITTEQREAAITAIADAFEQTVRFGTFNRQYVENCAEAFFDETLKNVRKRTNRFKRKITTSV